MVDIVDAEQLSLVEQVRLLSGQSFWRSQELPEARVPAVVLTDGPHGLRVQRADSDHLGLSQSVPATCFPTAVTLAASWDEELLGEVGHALGREAARVGVGVVLGPGMNIKRHPLCGRNFEYFSEDPLLSGRLAASMVTGVQAHGVAACPKHFAVNNQESHRFVVDAVVDERALREIYLAGFEYVVRRAGPRSIMAAYNSVNGTSMTVNRELLTGVLRAQWGFDGVVLSDWGGTGERAAALEAGMDLEMPGNDGINDEVVSAAVRDGRIDASQVSVSAQRILDLVHGSSTVEAGSVLTRDEVEADDALARRAAAAGTVLLVNDGVLPLTRDATVALIGDFAEHPRYQGSGSSRVVPTRLTTARQALHERGVTFTWSPGYDAEKSHEDAGALEDAAAAAARADVAVLMVGLPGAFESEGFDRDHADLPRQHRSLIDAVCAANPRTVVVLSNGAPVLMPWRDRPAAIIESYLGGQASGGGLVDVLYGVAEPGGRLAESFPESLDDVAAEPFFPGEPRQVHYREGLYVGYRHHTTTGVAPAFPFGHGLSYTTFSWDSACLSRDGIDAGEAVTVSVTVTNGGARSGSDVVQVYRHDRSGVVRRPRRELGGFAKVHLHAGESTRVDIQVPARCFAFWDTDKHDWQTPSGEHALEVARSSVDVVATLRVTISGGVSSAPRYSAHLARDEETFARLVGRPVPPPAAERPFTRDSTIEEIATTRLGRLVRTGVLRKSPLSVAVEDDPATALLLERSLDELPVRAVALFSEGRLSWPVVDTLLDVLNKRPVTGFRRGVRAALRRLSSVRKLEGALHHGSDRSTLERGDGRK